ncbi:MAG TPA: magnesium chelatase subunit D [Paracoccaceae bacterium]|nr:magnesium chelatase subunit D [Paracoccaceae bacterium]
MTQPRGLLPPWMRVETALTLLAVDPAGLSGLWLRARAGAIRDRVTSALAALPVPLARIAPHSTDEALYGGIDLAASLGAGRAVRSKGLLAGRPTVVLAMAERAPAGLAARLGRFLDAGGWAVALDEGAEAEEAPPAALTERLGLFIDLDGLSWAETRDIRLDPARLAEARARLPAVQVPPAATEAMVAAAAALGIASLRAPLMALAAARASAAFRGAGTVTDDDLSLAAGLVLAHRATVLPEAESRADAPEPPPPPPPEADRDGPPEDDALPDLSGEMLVAAIRAMLPADLLPPLAPARAARSVCGGPWGWGAFRRGTRRGRPLPARPGQPGGSARIDPVATLRAAAPWQTIRRRLTPDRPGVLIRREDVRLRRFAEASDRVLIFAVDASGSAAAARLAEAKGAVELLLSQAYARRDHVALVSFRGTGAEVMLPPTRSLVQTKRRLAGLPGGGGTPLAAGLAAALDLARAARARGMTPTLALLTDGRANVALDGSGDRVQARQDAARLARAIATGGTPALVIDTAMRPQPDLHALAQAMAATYLPLPRADARAMAETLAAALGG